MLWCCNWNKNEKFSTIADRYISFCKSLDIDTIVFDGYQSSTKDVTQISQNVIVSNDVSCPADKIEFLSNYSNKAEFIDFLANALKSNGFRVVQCTSDADTTIVKTALDIVGLPVIILADDTDILCLLLHHIYFNSRNSKVYLKSMKTSKDTDSRVCYYIPDVIKALDNSVIEYILFAHAFCGSDTTSVIYNFGKTSILSKLMRNCDLRSIAEQFYTDEMSPNEVGELSIRFFEQIHSPTSTLQQIRKQKYDDMVSTDRTKIDPALLPPSPRAAYYHGLRVYHQVLVWKSLANTDINPLIWGWKLVDGKHFPIPTDVEAGPPDILKIVRCGCKGNCGKRCSCRKAGLNCASACKECHGITCSNVPDIEPESDTTDRNFMDIFNNF